MSRAGFLIRSRGPGNLAGRPFLRPSESILADGIVAMASSFPAEKTE